MFEPETPAAPGQTTTHAAISAIEYPFRLLSDESVLGAFPIAQKRRPLGELFVGLVVVFWNIVRELGLFKAEDAQFVADPNNVDRISREVGALIIDVQARGKLAGKVN